MSEANKPAFAIVFVELNPCGIALKTDLCKSVLSFRFIEFSFTIILLFACQNQLFSSQSNRDALH
jgi:hypothetical protein